MKYLRWIGRFMLLLTLGFVLPAGAFSPVHASPQATTFTLLKLTPNIETIGVALTGENLPASVTLLYRKKGETIWRAAHPMTHISDGRLIGSLFNLEPSTIYTVRVSDGTNTLTRPASTQAVDLPFVAASAIYVDDDAPPGGDGSASAPYRTIQEGVNHAAAGTQVLVADGIYREAVTFPRSGANKNWIQVKAAGSAAILDGSDAITGSWATTTTNKVWFYKLNRRIAYLARDGKRFYNYDTLAGLKQGVGHQGVAMSEGWFYEIGTGKLYVRILNDPKNHSWQAPKLNHAFDINARHWIWIEGFEMRYYGVYTDGCGVCTLNASHIVIRKNKIHNMQLGVYINWSGTETQGNDTRIELNEIYDPPVNEWPWKAVKGSTMEGTGIVLRGHIGAIVRDNLIHNFFNGIYTGSSAASAIENPAVAFDTDIYNNTIHHIGDDALEPEGACVNQRFRNNRVDTTLVGFSNAPITQGPTWVIRNVFANFTSTSVKWALQPDGAVFIYHNTSYTNAAALNAMSLITWTKNSTMRNNIFQGNGFAFEETVTGSTGNNWNFNNWYTTRGAAGPHFKWENIAYQTMSQLCAATGLECNGHESAPGFVNALAGDFTLLPSSPNIDRGAVIPGINDSYAGAAPDIGAFESASP